MKFRHNLRNYLLAPVIIFVNPVVAIIVFITKHLHHYSNKVLKSLPKFDLYYSDEDFTKEKAKLMDSYLKLTQKGE